MWKSRFYELRDNFLFYYTSQETEVPKGIIFLEGCFIEETNDIDITKKYGFAIMNKNSSYVPHLMYCDTDEELQRWLDKLKTTRKTIHEKYKIEEKIGTGKFSTVYKASDKKNPNISFAIKIIDKSRLDSKELDFIISETNVLKGLDYPNVVVLRETIETKLHLYIVTDYYKDGDLFSYIMSKTFLEESEAVIITRKLLDTVNYLHTAGVAHRDLKPENIMIIKGEDDSVVDIRIIDFGFAKFLAEGNILKDTCGTPNYIAPEVLKGSGYDKQADMWSIGVIIFLMIRGHLPFDGNTIDKITNNTLNQELTFDELFWKKISSECKDFIAKLLDKDKEKRYDITEALKHPWIKVYCSYFVNSATSRYNDHV